MQKELYNNWKYRPSICYQDCMHFFQGNKAYMYNTHGQYDKMYDEGRALLWHILPAYRRKYVEFWEVLKIGGEGVVFNAFDHSLQRNAIFKIALHEANAPGIQRTYKFSDKPNDYVKFGFNIVRERMVRGSQIQAALHSYLPIQFGWIPEVYSICQHDRAWLEMELVHGLGPVSWGKEKDFPQQYDFFYRLVALVDQCHQLKVVHRDLKPANIKVFAETENGFGYPAILDWGFAKSLIMEESEEISDLSCQGNTGTFRIDSGRYSSPLLKAGGAHACDERDDIFSLGQIMLAVFLRGKLNENVKLDIPKLPEGFQDIFVKATAIDPEKRYQSCKDFLEALENAAMLIPVIEAPKIEVPKTRYAFGDVYEERKIEIEPAKEIIVDDKKDAKKKAPTSNFRLGAIEARLNFIEKQVGRDFVNLDISSLTGIDRRIVELMVLIHNMDEKVEIVESGDITRASGDNYEDDDFDYYDGDYDRV